METDAEFGLWKLLDTPPAAFMLVREPIHNVDELENIGEE